MELIYFPAEPLNRALLLLCLGMCWLSPALAENELGSNLAGLLDYALAHNPDLAQARCEADAASQRVQPAGALPDPVLRAELMDITNQGTNKAASLWPQQVGSTRYTLMQSVPWFGKRDLKREAAQAGSDQVKQRALSIWADLSAQIKSGYAQYYYAAASQKIVLDLLELVTQMEKVAQLRYANGLAPQQDVVRAQIEQTLIKSELIGLDSSRLQAEARLNALLSHFEPLAVPQNLRSIPASAYNRALLAGRIMAYNPDLSADEKALQASMIYRDLAYLNRYPDVLLGIAPTQSGTALREWGVMVEVTIPLQQETRRSQEREAEAALAAAKARKQSTANRLQLTLSETLAALEAAKRNEALGAGSLLPQAKVGFESAMAGYQAGRVDFSTLLDAVRLILKARQEILKAQTEAQLRLAELERLLGAEL